MLGGLAGGALGGALWGAVARVFMRLLTDDPQFTWSGTLVILGLSALAGAGVGLVHAARVAGRSGWWRLGALPVVLLFAGPGAVLAPATVGMAVVLRGRPAARPIGVLLVLVAPLVVVTTTLISPTPTQWTGLALMVLSAAPLGWALGEVVRRWRPRRVRVVEPLSAGTPAAAPA